MAEQKQRHVPMTLDITGCARCTCAHRKLRFVPFERPPPDATHWAMCPFRKEPILLEVTHG